MVQWVRRDSEPDPDRMPQRNQTQDFCPLYRAPSRIWTSWAIRVPVTDTDTITITHTDNVTDTDRVNRVREPDSDTDSVTHTGSVTDTNTDTNTVFTLTMLGSGSAGNSALVATASGRPF